MDQSSNMTTANGLVSLGIYPNHRAQLAAVIERLVPHGNLSHGGPSVGCGYGRMPSARPMPGTRFQGRHGAECIPGEFRGSGPFGQGRAVFFETLELFLL